VPVASECRTQPSSRRSSNSATKLMLPIKHETVGIPSGNDAGGDGVARATCPICWAAGPAEWEGASQAKQSPFANRMPHPLRRSGCPARQVGGLCHPASVPDASECAHESGRGPPHSETLRDQLTPVPVSGRSWTAPALWRFGCGLLWPDAE
jgi:hypothetical protein